MKIEEKDLLNYLFLTIFLLICIGRTPYTSRAGNFDFVSNISNLLYNTIYVILAVACLYIFFNTNKSVLKTLLNPLIYIHLLWMSVCLFIVGDFFYVLKSIIILTLNLIIFAIAPLLPENEKKMRELLSVFSIVILILCYFGIVFLPSVSIHQASDATEIGLAGDWRGVFIHKNTAGFIMALIIMTGTYIIATGEKMRGFLILLFALIFLIFAGSKSGITLIIPCLFVGYIIKIQKNSFINLLLILTPPVAIYGFTLGSYFYQPIREALGSAGVDTTFTGRTDLWEYVIDHINRFPIFGNGLDSHWILPEVKFNEGANTWVSTMGSAHNGFLEIALSNGFPMIFFFSLFAVLLPLRSYFKAVKLNGHSPLLIYFLQIWMYVMCASATESVFYGNGLGWGMFVFSIFGLYYLSKFKSI